MISIQDLFKKENIIVHEGFERHFYDGYCQQCNMSNNGVYTICFELSPNYRIIMCNKCEPKIKKQIEKCVKTLQKNTLYDTIDTTSSYNIMISKNQIESDWKVDTRYLYFIMDNKNQIYVPMIKENKFLWVSYRCLTVLNDIISK